jgi:hypothetical protein
MGTLLEDPNFEGKPGQTVTAGGQKFVITAAHATSPT